MTDLYINILGWVGAILVLAPYLLISAGMIGAKSYIYQASNIIGACLMICNSYYYGAFPSVFSNAVWIAIGFIGLQSIMKERKNNANI